MSDALLYAVLFGLIILIIFAGVVSMTKQDLPSPTDALKAFSAASLVGLGAVTTMQQQGFPLPSIMNGGAESMDGETSDTSSLWSNLMALTNISTTEDASFPSSKKSDFMDTLKSGFDVASKIVTPRNRKTSDAEIMLGSPNF